MSDRYLCYLCKEISIYLPGVFFLPFQSTGHRDHDESSLDQLPSYEVDEVKLDDSLLEVVMDWEKFHCLMQCQTTDYLSDLFLSLLNIQHFHEEKEKVQKYYTDFL